MIENKEHLINQYHYFIKNGVLQEDERTLKIAISYLEMNVKELKSLLNDLEICIDSST